MNNFILFFIFYTSTIALLKFASTTPAPPPEPYKNNKMVRNIKKCFKVNNN